MLEIWNLVQDFSELQTPCMCDLVTVNESTDPAVIELAEIEVEDSSYQFEVGEKFVSFEIKT